MYFHKVMAVGALLSGFGLLSEQFSDAVLAHSRADHNWKDRSMVNLRLKEIPLRVRLQKLPIHPSKIRIIAREKMQTLEIRQRISQRFPQQPLLQGSKTNKTNKANTVRVASIHKEDALMPAFSWPVKNARFTSYFGMRHGKPHYGIDLISASGTLDILAAKTGVVVASRRDSGGLGNLVIIDHGNGYETYYAHLSKRYVKVGDQVRAGDVIGKMGETGNATGIHLHFEVRQNHKPLNPVQFLEKRTYVSRRI